ncbi:NVEALA domain-containing protein, partial [Bacteroides fragilis]
VVSMFMREKREDPSSLVMMNVEALATGEGTSPAICVGTGSVVCPNDGSKVLYYR